MGDYRLGNDERTIQVDVDHLAELGCAHLMHRNSFDDAGIVHQDVNHPYLIGNACHELVYLIFVGHVTYVTVCLDAFFQIVGNTLVYQFLFDVVEDDGGSSFGQGSGHCKPYSVRGSGDQSNLTFQ